MLTPPLHELFEARHIAVVGASARMETAGGRVFAALLRRPFAGRLTPVNLRRKTVAGLPAFAHVGQIGEKPDVAVVAVPPQAQAGAVAACAASGVPYVLLLADEGGEPDDEQCAKLFKAAAGGAGKTQLVLCAGDGFNLPHAGLYADCFGGFPAAGRVAVLGRQAGFCGGVLRALAAVYRSVFPLPPTCCRSRPPRPGSTVSARTATAVCWSASICRSSLRRFSPRCGRRRRTKTWCFTRRKA